MADDTSPRKRQYNSTKSGMPSPRKPFGSFNRVVVVNPSSSQPTQFIQAESVREESVAEAVKSISVNRTDSSKFADVAPSPAVIAPTKNDPKDDPSISRVQTLRQRVAETEARLRELEIERLRLKAATQRQDSTFDAEFRESLKQKLVASLKQDPPKTQLSIEYPATQQPKPRASLVVKSVRPTVVTPSTVEPAAPRPTYTPDTGPVPSGEFGVIARFADQGRREEVSLFDLPVDSEIRKARELHVLDLIKLQSQIECAVARKTLADINAQIATLQSDQSVPVPINRDPSEPLEDPADAGLVFLYFDFIVGVPQQKFPQWRIAYALASGGRLLSAVKATEPSPEPLLGAMFQIEAFRKFDLKPSPNLLMILELQAVRGNERVSVAWGAVEIFDERNQLRISKWKLPLWEAPLNLGLSFADMSTLGTLTMSSAMFVRVSTGATHQQDVKEYHIPMEEYIHQSRPLSSAPLVDLPVTITCGEEQPLKSVKLELWQGTRLVSSAEGDLPLQSTLQYHDAAVSSWLVLTALTESQKSVAFEVHACIKVDVSTYTDVPGLILSKTKPRPPTATDVPADSGVSVHVTIGSSKDPKKPLARTETAFIPNDLGRISREVFDVHTGGIDVYIDEVRFPPECSIASRVKMRIAVGGAELPYTNFGYTLMSSSSAGYHRILTKAEIREKVTNPTAHLIFKLDGVDKFADPSKLIVSFGFALLPLFCRTDGFYNLNSTDQNFALNTGCFQIPVFIGSPDLDKLKTSSSSRLPLTSLLVRIVAAPRQVSKVLSKADVAPEQWQEMGLDVQAPKYSSKVYDTSRIGELAEAERQLATRWQAMSSLQGSTLQEALVKYRNTKGLPEVDTAALEAWYRSEFSAFTSSDPPRAEIGRVLSYDESAGFMYYIERVHGAKAEGVLAVAACLSPPGALFKSPRLSEGAWLSSDWDLTTPIRSQRFPETWVNVKPDYHPATCLVIEIKSIETETVSTIGWTMLPVFDKKTDCVATGSYLLPIVQGPVVDSLVSELTQGEEAPNLWKRLAKQRSSSGIMSFFTRSNSKERVLKKDDEICLLLRLVDPRLKTAIATEAALNLENTQYSTAQDFFEDVKDVKVKAISKFQPRGVDNETWKKLLAKQLKQSYDLIEKDK